jgi:hypothetical protein
MWPRVEGRLWGSRRGDVDQRAALHEGIQERRALGALEAAREEPVLSAEGHAPELILGRVVVDRQAAVLDEALRRDPLPSTRRSNATAPPGAPSAPGSVS